MSSTSSRADRCARLSSIIHREMDRVPYGEILPALVSRRPSFASGALPNYPRAVARTAEGYIAHQYSAPTVLRRPFAAMFA